jgi:circadian clock protein KaiB
VTGRARAARARARGGDGTPPRARTGWELRLYVAGTTPRAVAALRNLERVCAEHLAERYRIEVVDLARDPRLARGDHVLAVPTLVRRLPLPVKKIIGDLSSTDRVLVGLDLRPAAKRRTSR